MDNATNGFAQKIISELESIKRLIVDAVSGPREENDGSEKDQTATDHGN